MDPSQASLCVLTDTCMATAHGYVKSLLGDTVSVGRSRGEAPSRVQVSCGRKVGVRQAACMHLLLLL